MAVLTPAERLGSTLDDKYELESVIGRGGIGVVFLATHKWTGRRVAVKILRQRHSQDPQQVKRFLREARATAQLHHPNVVDVLDMGQADDAVYLALEFLSGETLRQRLEREQRIDPWELVDLLMPVLDALASAHDIGLIHRDLKPDNIFLSLDSRGKLVPKLLDFGLVKSIGNHVSASSTEVGSVLGTPSYMSPEQIRSETPKPASDVWSMGVVLYESLTGRLPFDSDQAPTLLVSILSDDFDAILDVAPEVSTGLALVVEEMLAKDAADRVPDIRTVMSRLSKAAAEDGAELRWRGAGAYGDTLSRGDELVSEHPTPVPTRRSGERRKKRSAKPMVIAGAVATLAVIAAGVGLTAGGADSEEPRSTGTEAAAAPVAAEPSVTAAPPEAPTPEPEPDVTTRAETTEPEPPTTTTVELRLRPARSVVKDSTTREVLCSGGGECLVDVPLGAMRRVTVEARRHIMERLTLRPTDERRVVSLRATGIIEN